MKNLPGDLSRVLMELGAAVVGVAVLARLADRWGFSSIPFCLLAGLAFGSIAPLNLSGNFIPR